MPPGKKRRSSTSSTSFEPQEGRPGSERTEVRVLYDADNIYFAIMNYDDEPSKILGRRQVRDGDIDNDDIDRIYLDPNVTRRNGYRVSRSIPVGARREALLAEQQHLPRRWTRSGAPRRASCPTLGCRGRHSVPQHLLHQGRTDWGFDLFRWAAQERAHPLVFDQQAIPSVRHLAFGHDHRHW